MPLHKLPLQEEEQEQEDIVIHIVLSAVVVVFRSNQKLKNVTQKCGIQS